MGFKKKAKAFVKEHTVELCCGALVLVGAGVGAYYGYNYGLTKGFTKGTLKQCKADNYIVADKLANIVDRCGYEGATAAYDQIIDKIPGAFDLIEKAFNEGRLEDEFAYKAYYNAQAIKDILANIDNMRSYADTIKI